MINDRFAVHLLRTGPSAGFLMGVADARRSHPQRAEFSIALALRLARDATACIPGAGRGVVRARWAERTDRHHEFFRSPIYFSSGVNGMAFSRPMARGRPGRRRDLAAVIQRHLDKALAQAGSTCRRVNRDPRSPVATDGMDGETVGHDNRRRDGCERATPSRRLVEEATSFRHIQDQVDTSWRWPCSPTPM